MDSELVRFLDIRGLKRAFERGNFVRRIYRGPKGEKCEVVLWDEGISFTVARTVKGQEVSAGTLVFDASGKLDYGTIRGAQGQDLSIDSLRFFGRYAAFFHGQELPIHEGFW